MKDGLLVKLCGMTNIEDIQLAARYGADYAGVVTEVDFSPRSLTIEQAETVFQLSPLPTVALVYNIAWDRLVYLVQKLQPHALQFLGPENPQLLSRCRDKFHQTELWQSIHLPAAEVNTSNTNISKTANIEAVQTPEQLNADRLTSNNISNNAGNSCYNGELLSPEEAYILKQVKQNMLECYQAGANVFLLDAATKINGKTRFGGTGKTVNWKLARKLIDASPLPVFLAGGINPANIAEAINKVHPSGIDLCSGVEALPGKKDPGKIKALMEGVKKAVI
ncbi:Phosphoribosylanthranilate isomerase [Desulfofarcimen acetoxidans DSM 771]|uniref:N-(5'-phosphoribosyl)anthranilate isomerase n=1 Tax=Desulfofarcimen acetoxidans (strain ATCC 49208 / DSM 771 / KCTC 5769 / VKM B-1644 / 5575) TaxID=485916 RepID=C8W1P6_DESAS|nr:phosphoribosylanthranilate isomerase [Desulfofarcimen acetoxidans]ACV63517.1 Phosphoribosylanthranilate isomerase [Desulfofarcimen acetoxidans DSM 771]